MNNMRFTTIDGRDISSEVLVAPVRQFPAFNLIFYIVSTLVNPGACAAISFLTGSARVISSSCVGSLGEDFLLERGNPYVCEYPL